ncbi:MAG: AGE family epimerase/isomerase [Janthinobacterium lividum]
MSNSATPENYIRFAEEVEDNLERHVLGQWFPRAVDPSGGFHQNYADDWTRLPTGDRSVVYQSRLIWLASQAARRYPEQAEAYLGFASHGFSFLAEKLWDSEHGGFYWSLGDAGEPERGGEKHVYGLSFAIYAAAALYQATLDESALDLAKDAYFWLQDHAHDALNGGWHEAQTREGVSILGPTADGAKGAVITQYGFKSMNTHIHLLESLTALYEVWPDPALRLSLTEAFEIVRDKIAVESVGCLNLFFTSAWRALPDHDSFGHDVETAFLLVEAAAALGQPEETRTWALARRIVDHALDYGWDTEHGGFYDAGAVFGRAFQRDKVWWVQAEGLNALLLLHRHFGAETDRYWAAFRQQWDFIQTYQIDARHGGWYSEVNQDGTPKPGRVKSDRWTEGYHQGRALLTVSAGLRQLAGEGLPPP